MTNENVSGPLPAWAQVTEKRRGHIERVTRLLGEWSAAMGIAEDERREWRDAGLWHDALRDAAPEDLRVMVPDVAFPDRALHGPAAAARLMGEGETRWDLLEAIRWHSSGHADWARTGRALYMADFLEPGRPFWMRDRAFLAATATRDFDGAFRQVVLMRLEWTLREGHALLPQSVELWNRVR